MSATPDLPEVNVAAVVSAFWPGDEFVTHVTEIASQVEKVFVVDDSGSEGDAFSFFEFPSNVRVLRNHANVGLAAALNRGVSVALDAGYGEVVTLDQDSRVPPGYVGKLVAEFRRVRIEGAPVVAAAPGLLSGTPLSGMRTFPWGIAVLNPVQSGLLVDVDHWVRVGGFRDEFFIDAIEVDYLLRLRRYGGYALGIPELELVHRVGSPQRRRFFTRGVEVSNQPTARRYFIVRNTLTVLLESMLRQPSCTLSLASWLLKDTVKALLFEGGRVGKIRAVWRGIFDCIRGRMGPYPYTH